MANKWSFSKWFYNYNRQCLLTISVTIRWCNLLKGTHPCNKVFASWNLSSWFSNASIIKPDQNKWQYLVVLFGSVNTKLLLQMAGILNLI